MCEPALYARDGNPVTSLIAEEGVRALAASLPVVVREPEHADARAEALYGAWLGGTALASVGTALHHNLCHMLGGTSICRTPQVHTIVLPHATAYDRAGAPAAIGPDRALDAEDAAGGLYDLAAALGAKLRLADIGLREEDLDRAADLNPTLITRAWIRALLDDAFYGRRPAGRPSA